MALNTRDTPLRRFSTYVWGTALMLGVCIVAILFAPIFKGPATELEDDYQAHKGIKAKAKEIHGKQAKDIASYEYDREAAANALLKKAQDQ